MSRLGPNGLRRGEGFAGDGDGLELASTTTVEAVAAVERAVELERCCLTFSSRNNVNKEASRRRTSQPFS